MNAIDVAAGVMLQTLHRRGRQPWPRETIVDPRLLARHSGGRFTKPGLELAVDALEDLLALENVSVPRKVSVHRAATCVARNMQRFWDEWWGRWPGSRTDDMERLNPSTLPQQLQRAYYRRHPKI